MAPVDSPSPDLTVRHRPVQERGRVRFAAILTAARELLAEGGVEGFTIDDDRLAERSYGPTRDGALAEGGIDREEMREAVQTYYGMMGWDRETGVPTLAKLQELGVGWAAEYLPK